MQIAFLAQSCNELRETDLHLAMESHRVSSSRSIGRACAYYPNRPSSPYILRSGGGSFPSVQSLRVARPRLLESLRIRACLGSRDIFQGLLPEPGFGERPTNPHFQAIRRV